MEAQLEVTCAIKNYRFEEYLMFYLKISYYAFRHFECRRFLAEVYREAKEQCWCDEKMLK